MPALFGRDAECSEIEAVLAAVADGDSRALLIGGDAGIGKSALVATLVACAAERGFTVLEGHCPDIEAGVAVAPVVEALNPLSRGADASRPVAARLARVLDPARTDRAPNLVDLLRQVVQEAAAGGPVAVVIEDMHWADRSTRDFAVALARTMKGPLLLVLTYRSDDLTRRHPFRKALVEIGRAVGASRVDLAALDRAGVAGLVGQFTGRPTDPSRTRAESSSPPSGSPRATWEPTTSNGEPPSSRTEPESHWRRSQRRPDRSCDSRPVNARSSTCSRPERPTRPSRTSCASARRPSAFTSAMCWPSSA